MSLWVMIYSGLPTVELNGVVSIANISARRAGDVWGMQAGNA
jgi:hypothetical protein